MTVGIYGIFDSETDECLYVGMSKNIEVRWKQHIKELRGKRHKRKDFVEWFHNNGAHEELLFFRILEECEYDETVLNIAEIKWFNELSPKYYGKKPSLNEKWALSDETRKRQSEAARRILLTVSYEKVCKICKKDFVSQGPIAFYCSDKCRSINQRKKNKAKSTPIRITKECFYCKSSFKGSNRSKACPDCKLKKAKIVHNKKCHICDTPFTTNLKVKKYCSSKCHDVAFRKNNPDWEAPKSSRFEKINKENLNRLYTIENRSIDKICEFFGCKERTIYYHLKNFGIPKRSYMEPNTCDTCGIVLKKRSAKNCFEHKYNASGIKPDSFCLECGKKTFNKSASYCADHRSIALRKGAHKQWHVARGIVEDDCEFCMND